MSSEQITQETVPEEKTQPSTETVNLQHKKQNKKQQHRQHNLQLHQHGKILLVKSLEKTQT